MISIIVGFRNREAERVKYALDSLANQSLKDFEVIFIDYGSDESIAQETKALVSKYDFAKYIYSDTIGWLWNRAHALNTGIKKASGDIMLFYDIDLIVEKDFLKNIATLKYDTHFYTFSCFYLPLHFDLQNKVLEKDGIHYEQNYVGLCAVSRSAVLNIEGFDEYYMVWGGEDDDFYKRLSTNDLTRKQIPATDSKVFHQWHPIQAPVKPTAWYLIMVNHLFSTKQNRELNSEWGASYALKDRPVLNFIADHSYKNNVKLELWEDQSLLFFNPLIEKFHQLKTGEIAYLENTYIAEQVEKSMSFIFFKKNKPDNKVVEKITKKDISQFFQFFIGCNRSLMQDYFYKEKGNEFLFVVIKK